MLLEDYFDFLDPDDIRLKGHRIGIDNVLDFYLQGCTPAQIQEHFPSLTLEQIDATIAYLSEPSNRDRCLHGAPASLERRALPGFSRPGICSCGETP